MMSRVCLLLCVLLLGGCREDGKWVKEEIVHGFRGKARVNPYLAAERLLESADFTASHGRLWPSEERLDEIETIFMPASFLKTRGLGKQVLNWISEGGMLVIFLEGGEARLNDFKGESAVFTPKKEEDEEPVGLTFLAEELKFTLGSEEFQFVGGEGNGHMERKWHEATIEWVVDDKDFNYQVEFEGKRGSQIKYGTSWDSDRQFSRMTTKPYGDGTLMLLAHARPFRNAFIDRADHAAFVEAVAEWRGPGEVLFLSGIGGSFFELLWEAAWPAIIAGLILLAAWLWMRVPRFGPILDHGEIKKHEYGAHLLSSSLFLWRQNQIQGLLSPLHARIESGRKGEEDDVFYQRLADESELTVTEVQEAMGKFDAKDPGKLVRVTRNLKNLSQKTS